MKNKSYIGTAFIILVFGIYFVPKIVERLKNNDIVKGDRLSHVDNQGSNASDLVTIGKKVPEFSFINQDNKTITNLDYAGKVYVLEFFFSTCPSICPIMNRNLTLVQEKFALNPNFGIASITINPEKDTPEVLKKHAELIGAKGLNWNFLTGDKAKIYEIANKGFNLYAAENKNIPGGFEHSGFFALIDKKGAIRCRKNQFGSPIIYYNGLKSEEIAQLNQDITKLLAE
jgi:protein SCO1